MKIVLALAIAFLLLTACEKVETVNIEGKEYYSASACSKRMSNGQVVDCDPTAESEDSLMRSLKESMRIDKEAPGPKGPNILKTEETEWHKVVSVTDEGVIVINNGVRVLPAGIECNDIEFLDFLKASFVRDISAKLAYVPTGLELDKNQHAYIWALGFTDNPDFGPTLSSINEDLIRSKWCKPIEQANHSFHHRYKMISNIE